jgi:hypothetical protein
MQRSDCTPRPADGQDETAFDKIVFENCVRSPIWRDGRVTPLSRVLFKGQSPFAAPSWLVHSHRLAR